MLITASNLDALFIAFSQQFRDAYMQMPSPLLDAIGTRVPSNTRDQRYPIVQSLQGAFHEWKGPRQLQNVVVDGFVATNKTWENSLQIQRTDVEDDQFGVYSSMLIPNLARHARMLPDAQIATEIEANNTCFDGRSFFASNHYINPQKKSGSQSNDLGTSLPLNATNLAKAQAAMMSFKGPDNLPLGNYGDVILVPPSLQYVATTLANAAYFPESKNGVSGTFAAQSNVFQGQYKVVVSPYLTDSGDPTTAVWYLLDCRSAMRAFFWQERQAPEIVSMVDLSNPIVFMEDLFTMGGRARGVSVSALWFKAIRVNHA